MYNQKLNEEDVFSYIKLGTDIAKIFIMVLNFEGFSKDDKAYCELVKSCNNHFKHLGIDYKIKKSEFTYIVKDIGRGVISKTFTEPFLNEKYNLFEIGFHLMYLPLIDLTEENNEKKADKLDILYKKFKEFLTNLKIPTYNLLELLFDNGIDLDYRMDKFTYEICKFIDPEQSGTEEYNTNQVNTIEDTPIKKKHDVFISHANKDKEDFVEGLYQSLKKLDIDIFYDKESLKCGDNWKDEILDKLNNSEFAIIVISENFFDREWTERELSELLNLQNKTGQKLILPIIHNITIERLKEKYPDVADIQVIDSQKHTCDEIALMFAERLINRIKSQKLNT